MLYADSVLLTFPNTFTSLTLNPTQMNGLQLSVSVKCKMARCNSSDDVNSLAVWRELKLLPIHSLPT